MSSLRIEVPTAAEWDGDCPAVQRNSIKWNKTESGKKDNFKGCSSKSHKTKCGLYEVSKIVMDMEEMRIEG